VNYLDVPTEVQRVFVRNIVFNALNADQVLLGAANNTKIVQGLFSVTREAFEKWEFAKTGVDYKASRRESIEGWELTDLHALDHRVDILVSAFSRLPDFPQGQEIVS
jgi:hypothetical protein